MNALLLSMTWHNQHKYNIVLIVIVSYWSLSYTATTLLRLKQENMEPIFLHNLISMEVQIWNFVAFVNSWTWSNIISVQSLKHATCLL